MLDIQAIQDSELAAQVENTLVISVTELLSGERPPTVADISNLAAFIQATVLFDVVYLPGRKGRDISPLTVLPEKLRAEDWYEYHMVQDSSERRQHAHDELVTFSSSGSEQTHTKSNSKTLLAGVQRSVAEAGPGWALLFWADIHRVISGKTAYIEEGVPKALESFSGEDYSNLSDVEKLALYYSLKSLYNVRLAVDCKRVFFSNFARNPLIPKAFDLLEKEYVRTPLLDKLITSGRSHWTEVLKQEAYAAKWDFVLPTLISEVLCRASYEKQSIAEAIADLRDSKAARRFREHYRKLLKSEPYRNPWEEMSRDVGEMAAHWREISRLGAKKVRVWTPFLRAYLGLNKVLECLDEIRAFTSRFRHMSLFWEYGADTITFERDAAGAIYKTFGNIDQDLNRVAEQLGKQPWYSANKSG